MSRRYSIISLLLSITNKLSREHIFKLDYHLVLRSPIFRSPLVGIDSPSYLCILNCMETSDVIFLVHASQEIVQFHNFHRVLNFGIAHRLSTTLSVADAEPTPGYLIEI